MIQAKSKIDDKIEALERQLLSVKGRETEKYARIVGYYRAVKNWNKGKKEEYKFRQNYIKTEFDESKNGTVEIRKNSDVIMENTTPNSEIASYMFFYRQTCPNCPPVKAIISNLKMSGESINADSSNGFTKAAKYNVFTAPTVIFFDADGKEITRTSKAMDLNILLEDKKIA